MATETASQMKETVSADAKKEKKQTKYKDAPPTAFDLFKMCHCNSNTSFNEPVKNVIAEMEVHW